jgi:lipid-binding SYLF domain-containing protein
MKLINIAVGICVVALAAKAVAWDPGEVEKLDNGAKEAVAEMLANDPDMKRFFDSSVAHVVIPTVGKAGLGIGGARGKGLLYEAGKPTAIVTLTQLSVGLQWGGQAYSEFLFLEDASALDNFKGGDFELGAQMSAVAVKTGASVDADFQSGVAIFTQAKGGLMYEAAVGGQKFKLEVQ